MFQSRLFSAPVVWSHFPINFLALWKSIRRAAPSSLGSSEGGRHETASAVSPLWLTIDQLYSRFAAHTSHECKGHWADSCSYHGLYISSLLCHMCRRLSLSVAFFCNVFKSLKAEIDSPPSLNFPPVPYWCPCGNASVRNMAAATVQSKKKTTL